MVSLDQASTLLEEQFETSESTEIERAYCIALVNLGRVRLAAGDYDQALNAFISVSELVGPLDDADEVTQRLKVQSLLGQALAHFWLEDVDKSLEASQFALEGSTSTSVRNDIAVLLARTLWGLGGEEAKEAAKAHLMEW